MSLFFSIKFFIHALFSLWLGDRADKREESEFVCRCFAAITTIGMIASVYFLNAYLLNWF